MSEMPNNMGISRFTNEGRISIGEMAAVAPTIKSELKILLPTTLPTANPGVPLRAETKLTQNSGYDREANNDLRHIETRGDGARAVSKAVGAPNDGNHSKDDENNIYNHVVFIMGYRLQRYDKRR